MLSRILILVLLASPLLAQGPHMVTAQCCSFTDSVSGTNVTTVPVGTTVQWNLLGLVGHTVTNGTASTAPGAGTLFDTPLNPLSTTFSFTFNTPGVQPYFCRPHEILGMNGTVVVTVPASVTTSGAGCVGSSGQPLTLGTSGLPQIGNLSFAFTVSNGPPGGSAFLFGAFGLLPAPLPITPGCQLFLDLTSLFALIQVGVSPLGPVILDNSGSASFPFPIVGQSLMGFSIDLQVAAVDPGPRDGRRPDQ